MISAVTTTHAIPQKLLPARIHHMRPQLAICHHCFQVLGPAQHRGVLEAEHVCKQKLNDRQPAATVPYN